MYNSNETLNIEKLNKWIKKTESSNPELADVIAALYESTKSKLIIACLTSDFAWLKDIYESGTESNIINSLDISLLFLMIALASDSQNYMEIFGYLYNKGERFKPGEFGCDTELHSLCTILNKTVAYNTTKFLIEKGFKVSAMGNYNQNVLDYYCAETYVHDRDENMLILLLISLVKENETSFESPEDLLCFLEKNMPSEIYGLEKIVHILEEVGSPIAHMTAGLILANFLEVEVTDQDFTHIDQPEKYYEKRLNDAVKFIEKAGQHPDWNEDAFHYLFEIRALYGGSYQSLADRLACYPLQSSSKFNQRFKQTDVTSPIPRFLFWSNQPPDFKQKVVIQLANNEEEEEAKQKPQMRQGYRN